MANGRKPGPICTPLAAPNILDDGTMCRCASPLPGVLGEQPEVSDHFIWGGIDESKPLGEEAWFERRYYNLLEESRIEFRGVIDQEVCSNWGMAEFEDQKQRIKINARDTKYNNANGTQRVVKKNDDRFVRCGDKPQDAQEADQLLGAFSIDIETPVPITYSIKVVGGKSVHVYEWTAVMYVEDVLGLQKDNKIVHLFGEWLLSAAPSKRVKRARWYIAGRGYAYTAVKGDSLSKIAEALTGDPQKWKAIHDYNRSRIGDPNRIHPGQRILIPADMIPP